MCYAFHHIKKFRLIVSPETICWECNHTKVQLKLYCKEDKINQKRASNCGVCDLSSWPGARGQ